MFNTLVAFVGVSAVVICTPGPDTALESLAFRILDDHVNHCVAGALASGDPVEAETKSKELLDAVHRFARVK